jgi:hypothetical protein
MHRRDPAEVRILADVQPHALRELAEPHGGLRPGRNVDVTGVPGPHI